MAEFDETTHDAIHGGNKVQTRLSAQSADGHPDRPDSVDGRTGWRDGVDGRAGWRDGDERTAKKPKRRQSAAGLEPDDDEQGDAVADEAESLLIEQARKDPAAFGAVYERYVDRIYAYIFHRVGNVHDAEDLTARTFYRALDKLDTYEDRGLPFSAWLFRIAHNLVANWHRDRSRRRFLSLDRIWLHSQHTDTPEEKYERDERHSALWDAINRLPQDRQNLLLYKFGSMLSNIEIGDLMGKSESAIKSLYFRTLTALRTDLESRGWHASMTDADAVEAEPAEGNDGYTEEGV